MVTPETLISLRKLRSSDLDSLVRLANNENVSRYLKYTFPYPYTRSDGEWWISTGSNLGGAITRAIDANGELAGVIGITLHGGWQDHMGEIGYWLGEEYWGRGIATSALNQMTDYGFANRQLRKLCAPVLAPNVASMRVLAKCGYQLEGVLKSEVRKHGRYFDIHRFVRFNDGVPE